MNIPDLPTYLQRLKALVDQAADWAAKAKKWAQVSLTGARVVIISEEQTNLTVGLETDAFAYFVVNNDLETTTFFLIPNPIEGTCFQIRNNGFGDVQIQPLDDVTVMSKGTLILRGNGSLVSLIAVRAKQDGVPALWDLAGDVRPYD